MNHNLKLSSLNPGESAAVLKLHNQGPIRNRLLELGFIPGTQIKCVGKSPFGDPLAFSVRGAVIALRKEDTDTIEIKIETNHCHCRKS